MGEVSLGCRFVVRRVPRGAGNRCLFCGSIAFAQSIAPFTEPYVNLDERGSTACRGRCCAESAFSE